jgi:hypothetical protein
MTTVKFDSTGEPLKISFIFNGLIAASYTYTLWEANSNNKIERHFGNNQNPDDDIYVLPSPVNINIDRLIEFNVSFKGLDTVDIKDYTIKAEIYQGDNLVGSDKDSGEVTGNPQDALMFFMLKAE